MPSSNKFQRRQMLRAALVGAGGVALRSVATGLPVSFLLDPLRAKAQDGPHRILIQSVSKEGEPLNANAPGMYESHVSGVVHPGGAAMAATDMALGGQQTRAAKPWADLPASVRNRMAVFHHATYTGIHAQNQSVMKLMGNTMRSEMAVSIYAKEVGPALSTTQMEPITLGAKIADELVQFDGRTLANVAPSSLAEILGSSEGPLGELEGLRERDIDRIYKLLRANGTKAQLETLDRYAKTRMQARNTTQALVDQLSSITGNLEEDQIKAAPVLAAMGLAPVITIHLSFGGDNHLDPNFESEKTGHIAGLGRLAELVATLDSYRDQGVLNHEVVVGVTGVFGRTLGRVTGRDHNSEHNVSLIIGDSVNAGVVGGCERSGSAHKATAIDPATGARTSGGGIPFEETLQSMAKTMGAALGVSQTTLDEHIIGGQVVRSALTSA